MYVCMYVHVYMYGPPPSVKYVSGAPWELNSTQLCWSSKN